MLQPILIVWNAIEGAKGDWGGYFVLCVTAWMRVSPKTRKEYG